MLLGRIFASPSIANGMRSHSRFAACMIEVVHKGYRIYLYLCGHIRRWYSILCLAKVARAIHGEGSFVMVHILGLRRMCIIDYIFRGLSGCPQDG